MLIVLTGTSSSGKTTLARAIQDAAQRPFLHFEADRVVPALGFRDSSREHRLAFVRALHEAIAALGRTMDVIADGSLPDEPALRDECLAILRGVPGTRVIAVRCSVDELGRRASERPDRVPGWADEQARNLYEGQDFDLEVDTSLLTPEDAAMQVLRIAFSP